MKIHSNNWHMLTGQQIVDLFDANLKGVTIQPNINIVHRLKMLESATLECLENRTGSTVYRIWQTGEVYQLTQPNGEIFEYDDYESFQMDTPIDQLLQSFITKDPVHIIEEEDGEIYIKRLKPPRFRGKYTPKDPLSIISDIAWEDQPNFTEIAKVLRMAGAFLNSYLSKK